MTHLTTALFEERDQAASAIHALRGHDFGAAEISVVATADDPPGADPSSHEQSAHQKAALERDAKSGVWAGSALGAAVAGYAALASMVLIPALPLVMIGGAVIGGVAGSMGGLGLAQKDIKDAEGTLRAGGALVMVRVDSAERAREAHSVLQNAKPQSLELREESPLTPVA